MRVFGFVVLLVLGTMPPAKAANDAKLSMSRSASVINTFEVLCNLELPNFDHIDAKATAMQMHLLSDNKAPSVNSTSTRSKAWTGQLTTDSFGLLLDEMSGPKGTATSCAVIGAVPDLDAFRAEAINTMKLAPEPPPEMGNDGSRSFLWQGIDGPGTTLILRDFKPSGKPGIMLKLVSMVQAR
jgi:hypothetical protein